MTEGAKGNEKQRDQDSERKSPSTPSSASQPGTKHAGARTIRRLSPPKQPDLPWFREPLFVTGFGVLLTLAGGWCVTRPDEPPTVTDVEQTVPTSSDENARTLLTPPSEQQPSPGELPAEDGPRPGPPAPTEESAEPASSPTADLDSAIADMLDGLEQEILRLEVEGMELEAAEARAKLRATELSVDYRPCLESNEWGPSEAVK